MVRDLYYEGRKVVFFKGGMRSRDVMFYPKVVLVKIGSPLYYYLKAIMTTH